MKPVSAVVACLFVAACCPPEAAKPKVVKAEPQGEPKNLLLPEEKHLTNLRQLTFGGDNAEAYWAFGGDKLVMQANKAPYKCDQIEELDAKTGTTKLLSTGKGRTTCAYYLKGDKEIVYASTHEVSAECPVPPDNSKGYMWGLFEYDIYKANADGTNLRKLTNEPGYDAEATVCPIDGSIIFTSTRSGDLELWRMDADGKNLLQLTNLPGYDGGAFFSPDCSKIVWRSSRPAAGEEADAYFALLKQNLVKPTKMDLWVANSDGTDARQVTYLPGASFAPFFFPNGKRIMFSSNFPNPRGPEFDLYAVDLDGTHLERITYSGGFDGFPVFSPDGKTLSFSSNRTDLVEKDGKKVYRATGLPAGPADTNVFLADWVDDVRDPTTSTPSPRPTMPETYEADAFASITTYLADDAREGRGIGTKGLEDALKTLEEQLKAWGLAPGNADSFRQTFEVTTRVTRGATTALELDGKAVAAEDFTPSASSNSSTITGAIVNAGWGIVDVDAKLDDYKGVAAKGKIVLVHRFVPPGAKLDPATANRLGDLRYKAFIARGKGAIGLIVVDSGDKDQDEAPLPALAAAESESGIPIIVVTRKAGAALAKGAHRAKITVALERVRTKTDNLVAKIAAGAATKQPGVIVIGAHLDHLGSGGGTNALDKVIEPHNGADDNASGVAGLMQVALALHKRKGELARDVYLVAFSAEEMGDLGSEYFLKHLPTKEPIVAMLNMDMIGRMRNNTLHVNGGETATEWRSLVEPACKAARVSCTIGGSGYGPSDHMPFYIAGSPVLFFHTGPHSDYHTATDDASKINAIGGSRVATIVTDVALATANRAGALTYVKLPPEVMGGGDARRVGASLGTMPSYGEDPAQPPGMILSDVAPGGPAATAGLKGGDRIIALDAHEIRNVMDLMFVLQTAKPGTQVKITYVRAGKTLTATATYAVPRGRK